MYLIAAVILISIVLAARALSRWQLPLVVIALGAGIIFGSDVLNLIYFDNVLLAKNIADFALIFILFIGGFETKRETLRSVFGPAVSLATLGVAITAAVTALALRLVIGCTPTHAMLLGCIIASTDAAAVFAILRGQPIAQKLLATTKVESATNDPMAIVLTMAAISFITDKTLGPLAVSSILIWQFAAGSGLGLLAGKVGCFLLRRAQALDRGYLYVLMIGIILFSYGLADLVGSSGMLAAFFAGYVIGNSEVVRKKVISTLLDAMSTVANVAVFVILGLLVFPREFNTIWPEGLALFAVLTFLARPLAVMICTAFGRFRFKEKVFLSWSGLRGTVPIVLATYPVAAGVEASRNIFNTVFFAVVLSLLLQGTSLNKLAKRLKLTER